MEDLNNIPSHWGRTKASKVGNLLRGINYKKKDTSNVVLKDFLPVLRGNNINGNLNFENLVYVPKENVKKEQIIRSGDIIFAMSSGSKHLVGKSAKAKTDFNGSFGAFCGVFRPNENFNKEFVAYFFQSPYYKKIISEISKGTNINNLKREHILDLDFPIPPLPEQQAIVSKIEELFSELDKGKQQLQTAKQQLKVYRQSLLKWAFEGKLTEEWRKKNEVARRGIEPQIELENRVRVPAGSDPMDAININKKKSRVQAPARSQDMNSINNIRVVGSNPATPTGWKRVKLGEVCEIKRGKSKHRPRNESSLFVGKYPFIQTGDIREANGGYINKYSQTYNEKGLQQSKLWPKGTLCITIAANIGETAILNFDSCFPDSVVGLLCNEKFLLNKFTNYFFISYKSKLEKLAPATAQKNINVEILEKVKIPLPSLKEQQLIVEELESKLTICDKIEETIGHSLQQAETLRQSILKKAFEGTLV